MALPVPILSTQTDPKSPVDDLLMDGIRQDLDDLDSRFAFQKTFDYEFKLNGLLTGFPRTERKKLDGALVASAQTFSRARVYIDKPGYGGNLEIDIRKYKRPDSQIVEIARQYSAAVQSITRIAPNIATQSIDRLVPTLTTQTVVKFIAAINITSIVVLEPGSVRDSNGAICANPVRYNLASPLNTTITSSPSSITIAGCTNPANDGYFPFLYAVNMDGGACFIVDNAAGVNQAAAAGTADENFWAYTFINPVDSDAFVVGENAKFSTHTNAGNDGAKAILAINSGGNNIVVRNTSGVAEGAGGSTNTLRMKYVYGVTVPTDFVVGETALFTGHTNIFNDGGYPIRFINYGGGNNIVVYSSNNAAAQGAPAGNANTSRFIYALPSDPSAQVSVGHEIRIDGCTLPQNDNLFTVKEVKHSGANNLVVHNPDGVNQAGVAGTLQTLRTLIKFASDQSAFYTVGSRVELENTASFKTSRDFYQTVDPAQQYLYVGDFEVLEINRGGGANYNIVIRLFGGDPGVAVNIAQASPAGRVKLESRSIFTTKPLLALPRTGLNMYARDMRYLVSTSFSAEATVALGDLLALELTQIPGGDAANVVVQLV